MGKLQGLPQIGEREIEDDFFFTHGHIYHKDHIPKHVDVLVYGHLHTGFMEEHEGLICVNTGSLSLPKNHTPHSYVVIDEEKISLKDIEGNIILEKVNQKRIIIQ